MATHVKTIAFELSLGDQISIYDLYQALRIQDGKSNSIHKQLIHTFFKISDNYIVGAMVSDRGDKRSLTTERNDDGDLAIKKSVLKENESSTEATLVCINPETFRGVFYQYVGSVTTSIFYQVLKRAHNRVRNAKIKDKIEELTNCDINSFDKRKAKKMAREMFSGSFELTVLLKKLDIDGMVSEMRTIEKLRIKADSAIDNAPLFRPLSPNIGFADITLGLNKGSAISTLGNEIKNLWSSIPLTDKNRALLLYGETLQGESKWLSVGENRQHYAKIDYDDYVDNLPSERWIDYAECIAMTSLKGVMAKNIPVFGPLPNKQDWMVSSIDCEDEECVA